MKPEPYVSDAPTLIEIARALGAKADEEGRLSGAELERFGIPILGSCQVCEATTAAYNSKPARNGFLIGTCCEFMAVGSQLPMTMAEALSLYAENADDPEALQGPEEAEECSDPNHGRLIQAGVLCKCAIGRLDKLADEGLLRREWAGETIGGKPTDRTFARYVSPWQATEVEL